MKPNYPFNELEKHLCLTLGINGNDYIIYTVVYVHPDSYEDYDSLDTTVVSGGFRCGLKEIMIDPENKEIILDNVVVYDIDKISILIDNLDMQLVPTPIKDFVENLSKNETIAHALFSYNLEYICTPNLEYTKPEKKYNICDN